MEKYGKMKKKKTVECWHVDINCSGLHLPAANRRWQTLWGAGENDPTILVWVAVLSAWGWELPDMIRKASSTQKVFTERVGMICRSQSSFEFRARKAVSSMNMISIWYSSNVHEWTTARFQPVMKWSNFREISTSLHGAEAPHSGCQMATEHRACWRALRHRRVHLLRSEDHKRRVACRTHGGFHGGTPIAGWFHEGKSHLQMDDHWG